LYIEDKKKDDAAPGIRAYDNSRVNGVAKTVTPQGVKGCLLLK